MLEIDGSYLEGGGQILRNALSLSCILRKPIRITKIRANRPNPGLSNQHLYGLNLLQQITSARVNGNYIKSTEVEFEPGDIKSGSYKVDTRTAASITLVLQAALPVLAFGRNVSQLELIGGTNVGMAPQVDYMTEVFRPNLELCGLTFDFDLLRRGYYPRGGGLCQVTVKPVQRCIKPIIMTSFGVVNEIVGWCFVAGKLPMHLADNMKHAVEQQLKSLYVPSQNIQIEAYKESADVARDNGAGVILKASTSEGCTIGADALAGKQIDAGKLGTDAAAALGDYIKQGICVDSNAQDQLILFMALAEGISRIQTCALTNHTRTAIHVAELMTKAKFDVQDSADGHVIISCTGIGYCKN